VIAAGVLTGWGSGLAALPLDARGAAAGREVIALGRPALGGDRFRRATRECLLGVAAVDAMLGDGGLARGVIRGSETALVYVTASAYGAANRAFLEPTSGAGALHFPYTAPSAVPAEVAIEFSLTGPYAILIGTAEAATDALWQAAALLARGVCERVVVLGVETVAECADLYARGRWLTRRPLVEAAVALLVAGEGGGDSLRRAMTASLAEARRRAGETLACAPLIALALSSRGAGETSAPARPQ
jgi:hypothetical protein